jgi:hypothetical protein
VFLTIYYSDQDGKFRNAIKPEISRLAVSRPEEVTSFMKIDVSSHNMWNIIQAGPAADLLFDSFQFIFSPAGFASLIVFLGNNCETKVRHSPPLGDLVAFYISGLLDMSELKVSCRQSGAVLAWDLFTAKQGRTLLGGTVSEDSSEAFSRHLASLRMRICSSPARSIQHMVECGSR